MFNDWKMNIKTNLFLTVEAWAAIDLGLEGSWHLRTKMPLLAQNDTWRYPSAPAESAKIFKNNIELKVNNENWSKFFYDSTFTCESFVFVGRNTLLKSEVSIKLYPLNSFWKSKNKNVYFPIT